ncbi:GbsR/MarR family transcriptional regulator [Nanoarchaeota archaeon]
MKPFEQEFIDFIEQTFQRFGLDSLCSRIVGIVFLEPNEVSMEDLAKKTGYSLASLSNKLRFLESAKMVKRIKKPGTKKSFYYIEKDVYQIMQRKMQAMRDQFMTPAKTILPNIIEKHKNTKMTAVEKEKMDIIIKYHKQLLEVDKCFEKHLKELER